MIEWIVTNCESVGNTHKICQDHTEYMVSNDVHVGALADGVSSNKFADIGAKAVTEIACQEICKNFSKYFSEKLTSQDFVQTIKKEIKLRYANSYDLNQMKSTLLLCAIYKNNYIIGHIGDGAVLCFGKESYVISPPQENDVGGTATYTILDYNADEHFQFRKGDIDDFDGFLLTSDGLLGNVYYSGVDIPQMAYELFGSVYKNGFPLCKNDRDEMFKQFLIQRRDFLADDCSLFIIARKNKTGYVDYNAFNGFEADVKWPCKCGNMNRMDEIRCSKCRLMYTSVYPSSILTINSKESFFSKLHKWIVSNSNDEFAPGVTAKIIDAKGFSDICSVLKANSRNKGTSTDINQAYPLNTNDQNAYEASESQLKNETKINSTYRNHKDVIKFFERGIDAVRSIGRLLESNSTYTKHQRAKDKETSREADIQKAFPIVLSYDQMIEAAYEMKLLPMEFVVPDDSISITDDQKNAVKAMFCHEAFVDVFQHDEDIWIIHYYNEKNRSVAIYDGMTNNLYCRFGKNARELLDDTCLIPRQCFKAELTQCNNISTNFKKVVLPWKWSVTYSHCKADASEMLQVFLSTFNKEGDNLDEVLTNVWFVAGNRDPEEMVAYILTKAYLLRLKSIDQKSVEVEKVSYDDNGAVQLRDKYLLTR